MHSDWSIMQNVNKLSDWLTLFALVFHAARLIFNLTMLGNWTGILQSLLYKFPNWNGEKVNRKKSESMKEQND